MPEKPYNLSILQLEEDRVSVLQFNEEQDNVGLL